MTVSLRQAWDICAVLDELDVARAREDSDRASYLATGPAWIAAIEERCDQNTPASLPPAPESISGA